MDLADVPSKFHLQSEVSLAMTEAGMKSGLDREGLLVAVAVVVLVFSGSALIQGEVPCLDENLVRLAMHEEAFRLLARKIDSDRDAVAGGFDFHIDQAYEKIKGRLPSDPLSQTELEAWLRQFLQRPPIGGNESEFQILIGDFIKGMSLEIINSLQFECEQAEDLVDRMTRLAGWMKKRPAAIAARWSGRCSKKTSAGKRATSSSTSTAAGAFHPPRPMISPFSAP